MRRLCDRADLICASMCHRQIARREEKSLVRCENLSLSERSVAEQTIQPMPIANDINIEELSRRSEMFSGAEVVGMCRCALSLFTHKLFIIFRQAALHHMRQMVQNGEQNGKITRASFDSVLMTMKPAIDRESLKIYEEFHRGEKTDDQELSD